MNHSFNALLNVNSIESKSLFFNQIMWQCGILSKKNRMWTSGTLHFNLPGTSPDFLLTKTNFYLTFHTPSHMRFDSSKTRS